MTREKRWQRIPPVKVMKLGLAVKGLLRRTADAPFPADAVLFELSMGFAVTRMLSAVVRHGIADCLADGPATAAQIAQLRNLESGAVHRVLRALTSYDVVSLDKQGRFRLTRIGHLLRTDVPNSMAAWLLYLDEESTQHAWAGLADALVDGEPAFPSQNGKSVWEWFVEHPAEAVQFANGMNRLTQIDTPAIVARYPWPETGIVCDVAGGQGALLAAILIARPELRAVLVDRPVVLKEASRYLSDAGVRDRVELCEGDIFDSLVVKADLFILKDVLHDWDDEKVAVILSKIRSTMMTGNALVIVEQLQPINEAVFPTSLVDVQMLTQVDGGRQRTKEEIGQLLTASGFTPATHVNRALASSMISSMAT